MVIRKNNTGNEKLTDMPYMVIQQFNLHCDLGLETQSKGTSVYRVVTQSMPTHW